MTKIETQVEFLITDTIPRQDKKLDQIKTKIDEIKKIVNGNNRRAPDPSTGKPEERRADPPEVSPIKKWPRSVKITVSLAIAVFVIEKGVWVLEKLDVLIDFLKTVIQ